MDTRKEEYAKKVAARLKVQKERGLIKEPVGAGGKSKSPDKAFQDDPFPEMVAMAIAEPERKKVKKESLIKKVKKKLSRSKK